MSRLRFQGCHIIVVFEKQWNPCFRCPNVVIHTDWSIFHCSRQPPFLSVFDIHFGSFWYIKTKIQPTGFCFSMAATWWVSYHPLLEACRLITWSRATWPVGVGLLPLGAGGNSPSAGGKTGAARDMRKSLMCETTSVDWCCCFFHSL